MDTLNQKGKELVSASYAALLLECSRGYIERLCLKGKLTPVATIFPRYYFRKDQVINLKESLTKKASSDEKN